LIQSFLQGLLVGFSIAAPVGPIGLLCIQRTLSKGRISGLVSGLGAATADATYGAVAGFGLTFISTLLVHEQLWIRLLGGAFLIYLGARIFLSIPKETDGAVKGQRLTSDYATTFALTLSNPVTIVAFAAVFAGLGLIGQAEDYVTATALVSGVFAGSTLWWVILSSSVGTLKGKLRPDQMRWVNRLSGLVIVAFGLAALLSLIV
jgi:threonine/homoserine/homoserine lactone efflux protein